MSERAPLVHRIAVELDKPSVYMSGPSKSSKRKAEAIVTLLDDEIENLRNSASQMVADLERLESNNQRLERTIIELREALIRAHAVLDAEHGHTASTWGDRERWHG